MPKITLAKVAKPTIVIKEEMFLRYQDIINNLIVTNEMILGCNQDKLNNLITLSKVEQINLK
jgi:hypothetical protein